MASKNQTLIDGIHKLFSLNQILINSVILFILFALILHIFYHRKKPFIQNRSPILLLMIGIGCFSDQLMRLIIISTSYTKIDIKCTFSIVNKVVFYYVIYIFFIVRILRVKSVNKINIDIYRLEYPKMGGVKNKKEEQKIIKRKQKMLKEARQLGEERVITDACVNYIVPLAILGLITNFIPYVMMVVPL
jgi:hypothetical protein